MARSRVLNVSDFQTFTAVQLLSDPGHIPGPIVVPNAVRVVLRWTLTDGKTAHNVLGGTVAGSFSPTATIAEAIRAGITTGATWTTYAGFLAPGTSLAGVDIQDIRTATAPIVSSTGPATPGTSAGTALPSEVALVTTFRTANRGPSGRG